MNRSAFSPALALLVCSAVASSAFAQAKPAATTAAATTPAPVAKAGFVTPLKGEALIQVVLGTSKFDPKAKEVVTTYKIKNMSSAPIAMLKVDEYWYKDKKMVSTDTQRHRRPFQPGEIIELTTRAPTDADPAGWSKNATFTHANGKVTPKVVKAF